MVIRERVINNEMIDPISPYAKNYMFELGKETQFLDYKKIMDVSNGGFLKILKDIFAFANSGGGYIVFGMEENDFLKTNIKGSFIPLGLPSKFKLESSILEQKIESYSNVNVKTHYQEFDKTIKNESRKFAILYIEPTTELVKPKKDGVYRIDGVDKENYAFRKDVVYIRRGTKCINASDEEIDIIRQRCEDEKYEISLISGEPEKNKEILYSNLFEVIDFPKKIYLGRSKFSDRRDVINTLTKYEYYLTDLTMLRNNMRISLQDLTDPKNPYSNLIENNTVTCEDTSQWLSDKDKRNILISLMNKEILQHGIKNGMRSDGWKKRLFFSSDNSEKSITWPGKYKKSSRKIAFSTILSNNTKCILHNAIRISFEEINRKFFLKINPTAIITEDGKKIMTNLETGPRITKYSYDKYNDSHRNDILFWSYKLSKKGAIHISDDFVISSKPIQTKSEFGISWDIPASELKNMIKNQTESDNKYTEENQNKTNFKTGFILEPLLSFGDNVKEKDPKIGLKKGGPFRYQDEEPQLQNIRIGIVSNRYGISLTKEILELIKKEIQSHNKNNEWLYPAYPGMNKNTKFHCTVSTSDIFNSQISDDMELRSIKKRIFKNPNFRIGFGANLFAKKIEEITENDDKPDIIICTLPKIIEDYCGISKRNLGAKALKLTKIEKKTQLLKKDGQTFLSDWGSTPPGINDDKDRAFDFRNALKGKIIQFGIPIQILEESTCDSILNYKYIKKPTKQDPCSFVWNFSTALLYKSNGKPWRLADLSPETCYVGISFFKDRLNPIEGMQTSMAQIFLHTGEGLVLRGNEVQQDEYTNEPHLTINQAKNLLSRALEIYKKKAKHDPIKIVIHKTTGFSQDEKDGFNSTISENKISKKDFVTINSDPRNGINFMRAGKYPPLRGTIIYLGRDHFLLYSSGYTTQIRTYPGHSIPVPLNIKHEGDSDSVSIAKDIIDLTKLDWNTASFSTALPITIKFAKNVGKILSESPTKEIQQTSYRFFM